MNAVVKGIPRATRAGKRILSNFSFAGGSLYGFRFLVSTHVITRLAHNIFNRTRVLELMNECARNLDRTCTTGICHFGK